MALATVKEKQKFVRDLMRSIQREVIENVSSMPKEWDGHELRQYLADKFAREVTGGGMQGQRAKDYRNTLAISNL